MQFQQALNPGVGCHDVAGQLASPGVPLMGPPVEGPDPCVAEPPRDNEAGAPELLGGTELPDGRLPTGGEPPEGGVAEDVGDPWFEPLAKAEASSAEPPSPNAAPTCPPHAPSKTIAAGAISHRLDVHFMRGCLELLESEGWLREETSVREPA